MIFFIEFNRKLSEIDIIIPVCDMLESTPYYAATWLKVNSLGPSIKCFEVTEKKELLG